MKLKVDAVVFSVNPHGFFCQAGPLQLFVSNFVCAAGASLHTSSFGPAIRG